MRLCIHVQGAEPYEIGGIAHAAEESLATAIHAEAETITADAGSDLLDENTDAARIELRDFIVEAASVALRWPGDSYRDPTGVLWTLED